MSSSFVSRSGSSRLGALLLAALLPVLATARFGVASCCVLREACCPAIAGHDYDRPELKAPLPQCCQQLVPADGAPLAGKATQAPGAPKVAVLSDPPADAVTPRVANLVAAAPAEAPSGAPTRSGTPRAPPQA